MPEDIDVVYDRGRPIVPRTLPPGQMTKYRRLRVTRQRALYQTADTLENALYGGRIGSTCTSTRWMIGGLVAEEYDDAIRTIIDELRRKANRIDV
jgi:hypothetical protein